MIYVIQLSSMEITEREGRQFGIEIEMAFHLNIGSKNIYTHILINLYPQIYV